MAATKKGAKPTDTKTAAKPAAEKAAAPKVAKAEKPKGTPTPKSPDVRGRHRSLTGFVRSDTREALRGFFAVDAASVVKVALAARKSGQERAGGK